MRVKPAIAFASVALFVLPASVVAQGQGNQGRDQDQGKGRQVERGSEAPGNRNNVSANEPSDRASRANTKPNAQPARANSTDGPLQRTQSDRGQGRNVPAIERAVEVVLGNHLRVR